MVWQCTTHLDLLDDLVLEAEVLEDRLRNQEGRKEGREGGREENKRR